MKEKPYTILSINPGSTSTRIAVYENEKELFQKKVEHDVQALGQFARMVDQLPMRKAAILACLKEASFPLETLSAIAARGGKLPPLKQGAYRVNADMVDFLTYRPIDDHASNIGALVAYDVAEPLHIPSYIYDAVVVDEMEDIARLTGDPELKRRASCHVLNMRAVALKTARKLGKTLKDLNVITCHMGGGISAAVIRNGRMIDVLTDEEGAFSPERAGGVPCRQLVDMCFSGRYTHLEATKRMRGKGGLIAYLGTSNALEVEARIKNGDEHARLIYEGMAYQAAKGIAGLASVLAGKVDVVVLTGALAHSKMVLDWLVPRIAFLGRIEVVPGEDELEALAAGVLRVLRGEETAHEFAAPK